MQALVARCCESAELMEEGHEGPMPVPKLIDARSPQACPGFRRVQHLRDGEEIALRATLTIKYGFILRSDLPEFACRAEPRMPSHRVHEFFRSTWSSATSGF